MEAEGDFLYFVSFALAINTVSTFFNLDNFKKRSIIALRDFSGFGQKAIDLFQSSWLPVVKRIAFFEILLCLYLVSFYSGAPAWYTNYSRFLLFFPQIVYLLFIFFVEVSVFLNLCYRSSFKNGRPYCISFVEFIFIFIVFGFTDIFIPSLFDFISNRAFGTVKTSLNLEDVKSAGKDITEELKTSSHPSPGE